MRGGVLARSEIQARKLHVTAGEMTRLLLLHGAGLGSWIWRDTLPHLEAEARALDLPGRTQPGPVTLEQCVDFVAAQSSEDSVLVGHSISAEVAMAVASRRPVRGVVLVGGTVPRSGKSFMSLMPLPQRLFLGILLRRAHDGIKLPPKLVAKSYCNDLDEATTELVLRNVTAEAPRLYLDPVRWSAGVPVSYVKLLRDESVPVKKQKAIIERVGAARVESMETGHLPMLAQPKEMARVLGRLIA